MRQTSTTPEQIPEETAHEEVLRVSSGPIWDQYNKGEKAAGEQWQRKKNVVGLPGIFNVELLADRIKFWARCAPQ